MYIFTNRSSFLTYLYSILFFLYTFVNKSNVSNSISSKFSFTYCDSLSMKPMICVKDFLFFFLSFFDSFKTFPTLFEMHDKTNKLFCICHFRFTIYKVHKASKKKREKSSAKKERKATKTLAIVLGNFSTWWIRQYSQH